MNKAPTSTSNLIHFPPELLGCVLSQIETAQTLSRLSQTCTSLHAYIENNGYRIFVQRRFPSIAIPASAIPDRNGGVDAAREAAKFWKDVAHGLTSLSRNWDRRALVAQAIQDPEFKRGNTAVESARARGQRGPTIGFIPVIDSYEAWYDVGWTSRKKVVAWGAGAKLVLRSRIMGRKTLDESSRERSDPSFKSHWHTYTKQGALEGRDDVTTLNLIPQESDQFEELVLGRASGSLERLRLNKWSVDETLATYETEGMSVRYATIHRSTKSVVAACLGDQDVALYPLNVEEHNIEPCASASVRKPDETVRTWSSRFLSSERLAVGLGRSLRPIHIYHLGQGSSKLEHVSQLVLDEGTSATRVDVASGLLHATSIYSLASLPTSSVSSGAEGDIFLSGGYDAHVRYDFLPPSVHNIIHLEAKRFFLLSSLHDLRLSNTVVSLYSDPVDAYSPIYSLLPIGCERFVAGGALHSLIKVFDLRMPGQKMYHATDVLPCSKHRPSASGGQGSLQPETTQPNKLGVVKGCTFHESMRTPRNWNAFLGTRSRGQDRSFESPVYDLSSPSSVSPTIYAGIQNSIIRLDIVSVLDRYPDPIYSANPPSAELVQLGSRRHGRSLVHMTHQSETNVAAKKWDPDQKVMNLPMYEQADQVSKFRLQNPSLRCLI